MFKVTSILGSLAWRSFWRRPGVSLPLVGAIVIDLVGWWLLFSQVDRSRGFSTIRYSIYVGVNWVAPWYYLLTIPLVGLVFLIGNILLAYALGQQRASLRYLLIWSALGANLSLLWLEVLLLTFNS